MRTIQYTLSRMAAPVAAILICAASSPALAQSAARSGAGPCRQGALAIIAMLERNEDNTPDYRHAFEGLTETCGPQPKVPSAQAPSPRDQCGKLALKVLDGIEENKLETRTFGHDLTRFRLSCKPL